MSVSARRSDSAHMTLALALLASMAAGCDESLPPRLPDPNAISVSVTLKGGTVLVSGGTALTDMETVRATVTNVYSEVLQDTVAVNIRCRISLGAVPDSTALVTLDASALATPGAVQNGVLTLLPGGDAVFQSGWNYKTSGGTPFWTLVPLKDTSDALGRFKISGPVEILMTDTARIFKPIPDYTFGPVPTIVVFEVR